LFIPFKILARKRKRRLKKFEKQLPEALDLLARGLRAGHAFPTGLQQVAKEMDDPLGTEFFKTFREFNHGLDLNTALLNLCHRIDLRDLSFFTTAVLIQRETGGNLTEILEKIAILIRERFKLKNQVKALTAEGRLSGLILLLLPPLLAGMLMVINPEYGKVLINHPTGRVMCGVAVVLQLLGMWCIHKIINIKV
jgi:tight adherence protein B